MEGILETADSAGPDAVEEWEVDELLDWTTSLNFDTYFQFWKAVGTSGGERKRERERERERAKREKERERCFLEFYVSISNGIYNVNDTNYENNNHMI